MTPLSDMIDGRAMLVGRLLSINPAGLGGVWVRARHGALRDRLTAQLFAELGRLDTVSDTTDDLALFGGIDISESLLARQVRQRSGVIDREGSLVLRGAERLDSGRAARIAEACDHKRAVILLDEGSDDDPLPHAGLRARLGFFLDETVDDTLPEPLPAVASGPARMRLTDETLKKADIARLTEVAASAGIADLRALVLAAETLRTLQALCPSITGETALLTTALLVFGHRAHAAENAPPPETQPEDPPADTQTDGSDGAVDMAFDQSMLVDAAATSLPADILATLSARSRVARGQGQGLTRKSSLRGRPLPSRAGKLGGSARVDLLSTLSAAAPWQSLRGAADERIAILPADIRVRQYKQRSERLIVFAVDMSGSAAFARLAEGKGAIELLLGRAYSERDRVALITFREAGAELVLPPTRALTRAKRCLQGIPAGGATPLAAGLQAAFEVAQSASRQGQSPHLVVISDGRANRAMDGSNDRRRASEEALAMARQFRAKGVPITLLDSGARTSPALQALAGAFGTSARTLRRTHASSPLDDLALSR